MKKLLVASAILVLAVTGVAQAIPSLQLDIAGGTYDMTTETIIASSATFTLYAYMIPDASNSLNDTYYLSMAVVPQQSQDGANLGSFTYDGNTVNVTGDMVYGVPPLEAQLAFDNGDLSTHGIFETYYQQIDFTFYSGYQIDPYNTQDRAKAGDPISITGSGMYIMPFEIDVTNLAPGTYIHFDLYNSLLIGATDIDVNQFAPYSHDAQSNGHKVPEPGMLSLLGLGLFGMAFFRRK